MPRRLITGFCLLSVALLSGCSNFGAFSGLFSNVQFAAKPIKTLAARHQFEVGDTYLYKIGAATSEEKVTRVAGKNVWWADNWGRQWMTDGGTLLPPKEFQASKSAPKAQRVSLESTGPLYPLLIGKSVSFRFATSSGGGSGDSSANSRHTQDCAIIDYGGILTKAGPYNVFKLNCSYDGDAFVNYYAPSIGRVVLQTGASMFATVERELIAFRRGGSGDTQMAMEKGASKHGKKAPHDVKSGKSKSSPKMAKMGASGKYGVQLAAYNAAAPARRAWTRIKKRGGDLLANMTPSIERHAQKSGALYRLIVGNFSTKAKAAAHCKALKRKRIDCWARPTAGQSKPALAPRKHSANTPPKNKKKTHDKAKTSAHKVSTHKAAPVKTAEARHANAKDAPPAQLHFAKP